MNDYTCEIDTGEGGTTTIQASDLQTAIVTATEWVHAGEWREDGSVMLSVSGPDGSARIPVEVKQSGIFDELDTE